MRLLLYSPPSNPSSLTLSLSADLPTSTTAAAEIASVNYNYVIDFVDCQAVPYLGNYFLEAQEATQAWWPPTEAHPWLSEIWAAAGTTARPLTWQSSPRLPLRGLAPLLSAHFIFVLLLLLRRAQSHSHKERREGRYSSSLHTNNNEILV